MKTLYSMLFILTPCSYAMTTPDEIMLYLKAGAPDAIIVKTYAFGVTTYQALSDVITVTCSKADDCPSKNCFAFDTTSCPIQLSPRAYYLLISLHKKQTAQAL